MRIRLPYVLVLFGVAFFAGLPRPLQASSAEQRRDYLFRTWMGSIGASASAIRRELVKLKSDKALEEHPGAVLERISLISRLPLKDTALFTEGQRLLARLDSDPKAPVAYQTSDKWSPQGLLQLYPVEAGYCEMVIPILPDTPIGPIYFFVATIHPRDFIQTAGPREALMDGESLIWWNGNSGELIHSFQTHDQLGLGSDEVRRRRSSLQELMRTMREIPEGEALIWALNSQTTQPQPVQVYWRTATLGQQKLLFTYQQTQKQSRGFAPPGAMTGNWVLEGNGHTGLSLLQDHQWCVMAGRGRLAGLQCEGRIFDKELGSVGMENNIDGAFTLNGRFVDDATLHLTVYRETNESVSTETYQLVKQPAGPVVPKPDDALPLKIKGPR